MNWQIITCEYPPQTGGVSDYTRLLAQQLRFAGDEVHVFAPSHANEPESRDDARVMLHRTLGSFSRRDFQRTSQFLAPDSHTTILVQWVPHGYGHRAMNIGFCRWIRSLSDSGHRVWLMVHEPYLEFTGSWKQRAVALVHRRMIRTLLRASSRVFISIPGWERSLKLYGPDGQTFEWLPIPETIPVAISPGTTADIRRDISAHRSIVGHLGTYSNEVVHLLRPALLIILSQVPEAHLLLLGMNSDRFAGQLAAEIPSLKHRIHATGRLSDIDLSHHLAACDLMLQPYPDGLSTRRTSLMNILAHGIAVVSNMGHLTEGFWEQSGAAALSRVDEPHRLAEDCIRLLRDQAARERLAQAGLALYRSRFDWPHVIARLRSAPEALAAHSE